MVVATVEGTAASACAVYLHMYLISTIGLLRVSLARSGWPNVFGVAVTTSASSTPTHYFEDI